MSRIIVEGGKPLCGEIAIQGSKNAALPILAATILVPGVTTLLGCPDITDVQEALYLLKKLGCRIERNREQLLIDAAQIDSDEVTDKTAANSRISVMLLAALIGRKKHAVAAYPGGCTIGCRPIDLHLAALRRMGVVVLETPELIQCEARNLTGTCIRFPKVSVGATESVILASVLSEGTVRIRNAACEPEICHMCDFLRRCGACIVGDGTKFITIKGVKRLTPCEYRIPADRIVCGTYLLAVAATGGNLVLRNVISTEVKPVLDVLSECGCSVQCVHDNIILTAVRHLKAIPYIQTDAFPGFPTDMQSQLSALLCTANGQSMIRETIFEGRFQVVPELRKMGASIEVSDDVIFIDGVKQLSGKSVEAKELRGSAALLIAGLAAAGTTVVDTDKYLKRGYQDIVGDFQLLGAKIDRVL